jgi:hypothetical protein
MGTLMFGRIAGAAATVAVTLLALGAEPQSQKSEAANPKAAGGKYTLSGPYTHANLAIFLIHGEDQLKNKTFLTLQEALQHKKVIVHETKQVNELAIENVSPNEEVFIQAGDIVKGGQQDRVIAFDLIMPAKSGRMPIASFCVEAGRWTRRGSESAARFDESNAQAPTKGLKLAVRQQMAQGKVWENVADAQSKLSANLGGSVQSPTSASSLQLTLENGRLQQTVNDYIKQLQAIPEGKNDVIGFAFAVNGRVNSADVYASHALFQKLWPVLLKGSAVEALAELKKDGKFAPIATTAVTAFLADADKGKASEKKVTDRVRLIQKESAKNILFECRDREGESAPVRRSYISK